MISINKLEKLKVKEDELNENMLYETLSDYISIEEESRSIIKEEGFNKLDSKEKIAVLLLARKAMKVFEMIESEKIGPTELSNISGIKRGTIAPKVRELEEEGLAKNEGGKYYIPNYNLKEAQIFLRSDGDGK